MNKLVLLALMLLAFTGTAEAHDNAPRITPGIAATKLNKDPRITSAMCVPSGTYVQRNHVRWYRHVACQVVIARVTSCLLFHPRTKTTYSTQPIHCLGLRP